MESGIPRYSAGIVDPESGQVYDEITVRAPPPPPKVPWFAKAAGPRPPPIKFHDGTPSLGLLASQPLADNADLLTLELLEAIPWTAAEPLWKEIVRKKLHSLKLWKLFIEAYPEAPYMRAEDHHDVVKFLPSRLPLYTMHVRSDALKWVTLLTIGEPMFSMAELVNLAGLKNLGGIDLVACRDVPLMRSVKDELIRSWARSAREDGAFPLLRVLSLRGWLDITGKTVDYLDDFPRLVLFAFSDTSIDDVEIWSGGGGGGGGGGIRVVRGWRPLARTPLNEAGKLRTMPQFFHYTLRETATYDRLVDLAPTPIEHLELGDMQRHAHMGSSRPLWRERREPRMSIWEQCDRRTGTVTICASDTTHRESERSIVPTRVLRRGPVPTVCQALRQVQFQ